MYVSRMYRMILIDSDSIKKKIVRDNNVRTYVHIENVLIFSTKYNYLTQYVRRSKM